VVRVCITHRESFLRWVLFSKACGRDEALVRHATDVVELYLRKSHCTRIVHAQSSEGNLKGGSLSALG